MSHTNRAQRQAQNTIKGQSKNQLLARASAAEAATTMFKGFYEEQIRANERVVIEAEQLVQRAQLEQRATERTIEVMLSVLAKDDSYVVTQDTIDSFNALDELGEHFVHVEPTDDGFEMILVFEPFKLDEQEDEDEQQDERPVSEEDESEDTEDSGQDGEATADGDTDETS